ncbi:hypothetical protein ACSLBF_00955 [Pseudoalteromonas sp. T1lg65]|uniref:hypothetical protein n=1 Tax=Pseudoalteromonas sp. T1lg65 TaxID=2077101 RepID=UPI003F7A2F37
MNKMKKLTLALATSLLALGSTAAAADENTGLNMWEGVSVNIHSLDIDKRFSGEGAGLTFQKKLYTIDELDLEYYTRFNLQMLRDEDSQEHAEQKEIVLGFNWNVTENQRLFLEGGYVQQDLSLASGNTTLSYDTAALGVETLLGERTALRGAIEYQDGIKSDTGFSLALRAVHTRFAPEVGYRKVGDDESVYVNLGFNF